MAGKLDHRQTYAALTALGDAKIVNLEASLRNLIDPVAESLGKSGAGGEVGLHVLCCNEYFLVTGLTGARMAEVEQVADAIRTSLAQTQRQT